MRKIRKTNPPRSLKDWIKANKALPNFNYDALPSGVKDDLKVLLLKEQGFICAYTGQGIDDAESHIEHLKPQTKCDPGEDVEYRNVVACFPVDGGDVSYGYGAPVKRGWWDEKLFLSPLMDDCARRFSFSWSGKIHPNPKGHPAATETISRIALNKRRLVSLRHSAIKGFFGFGKGLEPISKKEAEKLLAEVKRCQPPKRLRPFCFVFEQLLPKYIAASG